eukprot:6092784-Prymnesium_polylepis.1
MGSSVNHFGPSSVTSTLLPRAARRPTVTASRQFLRLHTFIYFHHCANIWILAYGTACVAVALSHNVAGCHFGHSSLPPPRGAAATWAAGIG